MLYQSACVLIRTQLISSLCCCGSVHGFLLVRDPSLTLRPACQVWSRSLGVSQAPSRRVPVVCCFLPHRDRSVCAVVFCGRLSESGKGFSTLTFDTCERTSERCWCSTATTTINGKNASASRINREILSKLEEWVICAPVRASQVQDRVQHVIVSALSHVITLIQNHMWQVRDWRLHVTDT